MQKINQKYINKIVKKALMEDLSPKGDVTTNLISYKNKIITARIISKQNGIISGLNFCKAASLIELHPFFAPSIPSVSINFSCGVFRNTNKSFASANSAHHHKCNL